jgi:hypothetical protein
MTDAIARSTAAADTHQLAKSLVSKAWRVTAMVYQLPVTTKATIASAESSNAVGAAGTPTFS